MKLPNGIKAMQLESGDHLYFWYANNRGRGADNVTIIRSASPVRATVSAKQDGVIAVVRTSGWAGNVNFSKCVQADLGL